MMGELTDRLDALYAKALDDDNGRMVLHLSQTNGAAPEFITTLIKAWPTISAEIDRLTGEVGRLENEALGLREDTEDRGRVMDLQSLAINEGLAAYDQIKAKADALAEAVQRYEIHLRSTMPLPTFNALFMKSKPLQEMLTALKAYQEKTDG